MEKFKTQEFKVSGPLHPEHYHYEWQFTPSEKEEIRNILKNKASEKKINSFIHYLQGLCELKKQLLEQPHRLDVREARERVLADCKKALRHLKRCEKGEIVTWRDDTIDPLWSYRPEQKKICSECKHPFTTNSEQREKCVECEPTPPKAPYKGENDFLVEFFDSSEAAVGPLEKFIKVLEKYHKAENKKIGRKKADNDNFIRKVKEIYVEHIGTPTTYGEGSFFEVVRFVLNMLNLQSNDPSRAIRAVLKEA